MTRFSDDELVAMRQAQELYHQKLDDHILQEGKRWDKLLQAQEENAIRMEGFMKSMEGILEAWQVATGGMKFLVLVGKFAKWLASLAIFVAIAHWFGWGNGK